MKKLLLTLCLISHTGYSQVVEIDSLKTRLKVLAGTPESYRKDTSRYQLLRNIMKAYVDINIDSASHYNALLIALCSKPAMKNELVYAYQYAGYIHQVRGDFHQSIRFHYKALPIAEETKQYARMAASQGWLAHAYTSLKEFDKAAKFCRLGLQTLRLEPDSYVESSILNVQGAIFRQQGKLKDALKTNQQLYELAKGSGDQWYEAQGLHAIGWVYKEMDDMPHAIQYFNRALALARTVGSVDLEGSILLNISDLYFRQRKWDDALQYCNAARDLALKVRNSSIEVEAYEHLYKIFKQTRKPKLALEAHERFVLLKDSLSKEKTEHRIETLQAQYDNVQKSNELNKKQVELLAYQRTRNGLFIGIASIIVIAALLLWNNRRLQSKNQLINGQKALIETARMELADNNKTLERRVMERTQELVDANEALSKKNEEIKKALFKGQSIERKRVAVELHDNLSSLLSAVNMSIQHVDLQHMPESERPVFQNIRHLIQNAYAEVRNISHNILPAELEKEGLSNTLNSLVSKLNQNSPLKFSLATTGFDRRLPIEIEFNVYSIVLELMNNAIKHAKANVVGINLSRTDDGVDLAVTDDGIGLGSDRAKTGVGLLNIQSRLESLGGTFSTVLPDETGTRIAIKIPIESDSFNGSQSGA